jgi:lipopolysaccharide/colanic/teichoic acid biosynthesis glycosyltransferase
MQVRIKRLFDIVSSGLALILLSPLLFVIILLVRLDSPGPIIFKQIRVGRNGKKFRIWKFRTMWHRDADVIDQNAEKILTSGRDPRITRAGLFLRKSSLDELPQLWNIFKGDMSVVGPRPVLPEQEEVVPPRFSCRFNVRPGLTGLAQVRGRRSLGWLEQLAVDAEYVERRGIFLDLWIMIRTVAVLITGSGVYSAEAQNWRAYRDSLNQQKIQQQ